MGGAYQKDVDRISSEPFFKSSSLEANQSAWYMLIGFAITSVSLWSFSIYCASFFIVYQLLLWLQLEVHQAFLCQDISHLILLH